jgi:hypothetical protein
MKPNRSVSTVALYERNMDPRHFQTGSGVHPASYKMGIGRVFPGATESRERS